MTRSIFFLNSPRLYATTGLTSVRFNSLSIVKVSREIPLLGCHHVHCFVFVCLHPRGAAPLYSAVNVFSTASMFLPTISTSSAYAKSLLDFTNLEPLVSNNRLLKRRILKRSVTSRSPCWRSFSASKVVLLFLPQILHGIVQSLLKQLLLSIGIQIPPLSTNRWCVVTVNSLHFYIICLIPNSWYFVQRSLRKPLWYSPMWSYSIWNKEPIQMLANTLYAACSKVILR